MKKTADKRKKARDDDEEQGRVARLNPSTEHMKTVQLGSAGKKAMTAVTTREVGEESGQVVDNAEHRDGRNRTSGPSPSVEDIHSPGAFAISGIDPVEDSSIDITSSSVPGVERRISTMTPVSAQVVDADEDDRVEERANRLLRERLQSAPVARVVTAENSSAHFLVLSMEVKRVVYYACALLLTAAALSVALAVLLTRDAAGFDGAPIFRVQLKNLLFNASLDGGEALGTSGTPQNRAFKWLIEDSVVGGYKDYGRLLQRYALATLYFSTNGDNWTANNWLDHGDECDGGWWSLAGYITCTENGEVYYIALYDGNLHGNIPDEITLLSDSLEGLSLWSNKLTGPLPTSIGRLINLLDLDLAENEISGIIPKEIGELTQMTSLSISDNSLSGSVPAEIGQLHGLESLYLKENLLSGSIPSEVTALSKLTSLRLDGNRISGPFPTMLFNMTALESLGLGNELTGSIPTEIVAMSNLDSLYLGLTGSIPTILFNMTALEALTLGSELTGSIPNEITLLSNLSSLWLGENQLSGSIPTYIGNMTALIDLDLSDNDLTGPLPSEIMNLSDLTILLLYNNSLTGTIPEGLKNMTSLDWLELYGNKFTGAFECPDDMFLCLVSCDDYENPACLVL